MDKFPLLCLYDHRKFQTLLEMLQCMVTLGRPEIYQLVTSLNRFGACSREGHLDLVVRDFEYVKTTLNKQIDIDSRPTFSIDLQQNLNS